MIKDPRSRFESKSESVQWEHFLYSSHQVESLNPEFVSGNVNKPQKDSFRLTVNLPVNDVLRLRGSPR